MCEACKSDPSLASYYHGCRYCNIIPDEHGECGCAPDDYVRPGDESLLYVNAYEMTRHYGGPEEGGWYYNHLEPIASIPIRAISVEGHSDICWTCSNAREGVIDAETGEKYEFCKWSYQLKAADTAQVDMFREHLEDLFADVREGNIYSVLGGTDFVVAVEDHPGAPSPRPHYE